MGRDGAQCGVREHRHKGAIRAGLVRAQNKISRSRCLFLLGYQPMTNDQIANIMARKALEIGRWDEAGG